VARVIKAGAGGNKPARPPTRVIVAAGAKKVIERELFQAKQDAEHILMRAQQEAEMVLADGKKLAARAREEAMARGASEAFATAASEALAAFRRRADRYGEAADDIRALALEVARKVLGNEPDLGPKDVDKILQKGMAQLRARRRLRVQVSIARLAQLQNERPNLMKFLQNEPDLVVESVDDVSVGFARVVTEVGGALCAEETALDALSQAVNVREQPRAARANSGVTDVSTAPKMAAFKPSTESVPDAAIEQIDEEEDETLNMSPASRQKPKPSAAHDDVEEIEAEEDEMSGEELDDHEESTTNQVRRSANGRVQVGATNRPSTRVVPIDPRTPSKVSRAARSDEGESTLRAAKLASESRESADEDLDLFTDDAVKTQNPPRKRR
jgi:flagellar biosynthesis/type III secretory pathway protein FliH